MQQCLRLQTRVQQCKYYVSTISHWYDRKWISHVKTPVCNR